MAGDKWSSLPLLILAILVFSGCSSDAASTDGDAADGDLSEREAVEDEVTEDDAGDGDVLDGDVVDGDVIDGDVFDIDDKPPDGDVVDGDLGDGDLTDGDLTDGDLTDGDHTDGDLTDGDLTDGDFTDVDLMELDLEDVDLTDGEFEIVHLCSGHGVYANGICLCDHGYYTPPESFEKCVQYGDVDDSELFNCCTPNPDSPGCLDQEVQDCVCDVYDWCCTTRWNEYCVNLVNLVPCGFCPEGDVDEDAEDEVEQSECGAVAPLNCDDTIVSDNYSGTSFFDDYPGCGFGSAQWAAPEVIYSYTSQWDCINTVELNSPEGNLDLFIIDPCDSSVCHGYGVDFGAGELQQFISLAGQEFQIVIDGRYGAMSQFSIELTCECDKPPADGDEEEEFDVEIDGELEADAEEDAEADAEAAEEDPDLPPLCAIPAIRCGDTVGGDTSTQESHWSSYDGCGAGLAKWTGGDQVYALFADNPIRTGQVTVDLNSPAGDLDLFLLDFVNSDCLTGQCLAERTTDGSTESLSFEFSESPLAFIVVDGRFGAGSEFNLSVACEEIPLDGDEEEDFNFEFDFDIFPPDGDSDIDSPADGDLEEWDEGPQCPLSTVTCGDFYFSDDSSMQDLWNSYPGLPLDCGGGNASWTGPEWIYRFVAWEDCTLRVNLEALTANLDLFLLDALPECNQGLCMLDSVGPDGLESMNIQVISGEDYYFIVESMEDLITDFSISFDCICGADGDLDLDPDEGPIYEGDCCLANGSIGCEDAALSACVCAQDFWCCEVSWNEICVSEVDQFGCGSCGSGDEEVDEDLDPDPEEEDLIIYEGDCCLANGSPACELQVVADCVCDSKPGCCTDDWSETCVGLVNGLGCGYCGSIDGDLDDDPDPDSDFELPELTDIDLPSTDCCQAHDTPLCKDNDINICVCEVNLECCAVEWSQMCVELVESLGCGDCSPPDGDIEYSDSDQPPPFVCPGDAGNEVGVGLACTVGGGECPQGLDCLLDIGGGSSADICVLLNCTGNEQCGSGATCVTAGFGNVCLPNRCFGRK